MTHCSIAGGKILSCCYCGVQSSFLPSGSGGVGKHSISALVCGTCGAPLSAQKARPLSMGKGARLPAEAAAVTAKPKAKNSKKAKRRQPCQKPAKVKPRKKRKGLFHKLVSEAFDLVEDVFD